MHTRLLTEHLAAGFIALSLGDFFKALALAGVLPLAGILRRRAIGLTFTGIDAAAMYFRLLGMSAGGNGYTAGKQGCGSGGEHEGFAGFRIHRLSPGFSGSG